MKKYKPYIYIHIGTAKTGTTAIQNFIGNNLDKFSGYGFYYPKTGLVNNCHHGIAFYWGKDNYAFKKIFNIHENQLEKFSEEIANHINNNIVISSECLLLHTIDWNELISILPHKNIKIIVYFRRQDLLLEANYKEQVKGNKITLKPEKWISKNYFPNQYLSILQRFSEMFGKDNIIVGVYEKQQFKEGSIYADFCNIFSIPLTDDFAVSKKNFNPHLSRDALEFNRLINTVIDDKTNPYLFSSVLTSYTVNEDHENSNSANKRLFSPKISKEILEACKNVNSTIAKEYLGREDGCLFYDPEPNLDEPWEPYPGLPKSKAKEIVNYIYDKRVDLLKKLYTALKETVYKDENTEEAKEILLPILKEKLHEK